MISKKFHLQRQYPLWLLTDFNECVARHITNKWQNFNIQSYSPKLYILILWVSIFCKKLKSKLFQIGRLLITVIYPKNERWQLMKATKYWPRLSTNWLVLNNTINVNYQVDFLVGNYHLIFSEDSSNAI